MCLFVCGNSKAEGLTENSKEPSAAVTCLQQLFGVTKDKGLDDVFSKEESNPPRQNSARQSSQFTLQSPTMRYLLYKWHSLQGK